MKQLIVICLSEASPELVSQWTDAGRLKTLADIRASGLCASTAYGIPYLLTPQLWATITTGRTPGYHGVFDYWQRDRRGVFRPTTGADVKQRRFWELLSDRGMEACVVNVPMTYPPRPINGIVIAGQDAPGPHRTIAHPQAVYERLVRQFGPYQLKDIFPGGRSKDDYLTLIESSVEWQTTVLEHLLQERNWNLFMCYFGATAMAQHYFWSDMTGDADGKFNSLIPKTYQFVDRAIDRLRARANDDAMLVVMSECGAGPLRAGIQVNTALAERGLLRYARAYAPTRTRATGTRRGTIERARRMGQRVLPQSLYYRAASLPIRTWIQSYLATSDIDWRNTRVYYRGKGEGNLYVNLAGREARGVVAPRDYERVRDAAIEALSQLVDPATGSSAVTKVHRREELYEGPYLELAPDLVIEWAGMEYMPTEQDRGKETVFGERWREYMEWPTTGSHRMRGILLACGPTIRDRGGSEVVPLVDIAPTFVQMLTGSSSPELEGEAVPQLVNG